MVRQTFPHLSSLFDGITERLQICILLGKFSLSSKSEGNKEDKKFIIPWCACTVYLYMQFYSLTTQNSKAVVGKHR